MPEIQIEEIGGYLKKQIARFQVEPIIYRRGRVASVGDGVVRVKGLPDRLYGELLEFDGGVYGMALDLEEDGVGAVLMDNSDTVNVGDGVKGTGVVAEVPVGDELLGRVIDPIGRPLDGEPLKARAYLPCERPAPTIMQRRPVDKPLETGILAIDSMIPVGRGQRELIIGDRQTGKTSIAIDTIINQKSSDVICIYCAIGQKASNIARIIETLTETGAMEYSLVVASTASDSPAMQYLAPYAACAVAEGFMEKGKDYFTIGGTELAKFKKQNGMSKHCTALTIVTSSGVSKIYEAMGKEIETAAIQGPKDIAKAKFKKLPLEIQRRIETMAVDEELMDQYENAIMKLSGETASVVEDLLERYAELYHSYYSNEEKLTSDGIEADKRLEYHKLYREAYGKGATA